MVVCLVRRYTAFLPGHHDAHPRSRIWCRESDNGGQALQLVRDHTKVTRNNTNYA